MEPSHLVQKPANVIHYRYKNFLLKLLNRLTS